jgi:hypothetical protein
LGGTPCILLCNIRILCATLFVFATFYTADNSVFPYSNAKDMRVTQDLNSFGEIIAHAQCSVDENKIYIFRVYHIRIIAKNVFGKKMPLSLLANGALCLNTPKRNCKSSTDLHQIRSVERLESQITIKARRRLHIKLWFLKMISSHKY